MQRLKVKEVLKPSVSNGVFCILFVAVDKKYAAGGKQETTAGKSGPPEAVPYKRKAPVGTKRKPARRERIPTTSLRTGLGMTGLAYERIFQRPNKACAFLCQSVLHGRMAAVPAKRKNSACFLSPGHI